MLIHIHINLNVVKHLLIFKLKLKFIFYSKNFKMLIGDYLIIFGLSMISTGFNALIFNSRQLFDDAKFIYSLLANTMLFSIAYQTLII